LDRHGLRHHGHRARLRLVKFKKLAGGGYFKIINQSLPMALTALSYPPHQIDEIVNYCVGRKTLEGAPPSITTR